MGEFFGSYFRGDYMPHGHCYLWQPHILWVNVISDLIIAAAYFSIPIALMVFIRNRPDIEHRAVFILFSAFILLCGITHLMGIWTIWQGVYGLHGIAKFTTAVVSMITAFSLYKLMPQIVKLPTLEQYEGVVNQWSDSKKENEFLSSQLQSQKLTQFVLDSIPISLLLIDNKGQVILSNSFYNKEFNGDEPLVGRHISSIFHGNSADFQWQFHQDKLFEKVDLGEQVKFIDSVNVVGNLVPVEVVITKKEYQNQPAFVITIKDLREVTQIKQMLIDSNSRFERAVRATEEGLWEWNLNSNKMIWSPKFYSMSGIKLGEEPRLGTWLEQVHPDYREAVSFALNNHLEQGDKFHVEYIGKNEQGSFGWFAVNGNSLQDINGRPTVMSGSLRYIEHEKQKEEKYLQKNKLLNAIYEGANHAIWIVKVKENGEMSFDIINETSLKIMAVDKDLILHKPISELRGTVFPASFIDHITANYKSCIESKTLVEYVEHVNITEPLWFKTTLYPVLNSQQNVDMIVGTAIDISELKKIEEKLENNTEFLENLVNNSVCGVYIFDLKSQRNVQINARYQSILGYSEDDLAPMENLLSLFHPSEIEMVLEHMEEVGQSADGELIPLEYRFKHKSGQWVWCYSIDSVLTRNADGSPSQILGTFVDVTEKNELLTKLRESNEYLERFAFVASHDLQEPLRKISAFSESIAERLGPLIEDDDDTKYELSRMESAASRMSTMIHDLLQLSRINSKNLKKVRLPLSQLVTEVLELLDIAIKERNAVVSYEDINVDVFVDSGLMDQLLQNVISNSLKFCKQGCKPSIKISSIYFDEQVEIRIEDNGIGVEQDFLSSIFEPFRRLNLREEYEGSGIGLAIVNQIVQIHNGQIRCESTINEGTTIIITLPRA